MPPNGAAQRAEQCAAVAAASHAMAAAPGFRRCLAELEDADLGPEARVNMAEAWRVHRRATRIPSTLAEELARVTAQAQLVWEAAREVNRFADFAPILGRVVALKRAEAACLAEPKESAYDALLREFEPGMTTAALDGIFARLRPGLTALRARIAQAGRPAPRFEGRFAKAGQIALARRLGDVFGYDWAAGRLDLAAHPSSQGTGGDVRITTRVNERDPQDCLYSTIHEVGHAVYEQGLDPAQAGLPAGMFASMGVHESQSRLFENQFGRSRAFCEWLCLAAEAQFGATGLDSPEALFAAVNAVETGFIRTDADEVHYNLHVMMRFDLERDLIAGALDVADLESAWNARFTADFGREVPDARRGVLQDVHWAVGLFGYFPTYTLGNIYAAELHAALRRAVPDLDRALADGDLHAGLDWLRANVHRKGRLLAPRDLIAQACGHAPSEAPLLRYLEAKFGLLYGV